jgi:hypothetical protein
MGACLHGPDHAGRQGDSDQAESDLIVISEHTLGDHTEVAEVRTKLEVGEEAARVACCPRVV